MSQENPKIRQTLTFNAINFGATSSRVFRTPKGMRGRVRLAALMATTSFVGTTTPGKVQVGDGVTANKYLDLFAGAAGAGTVAANAATASDFASGLTCQPNGGPYLYLDPDTQYTITFAAPVGGAPAGVADVAITVDYD